MLRHKDCKPTECPGTNMNIFEVVRMAIRSSIWLRDSHPGDGNEALAQGRRNDSSQIISTDDAQPAAGTELLFDALK